MGLGIGERMVLVEAGLVPALALSLNPNPHPLNGSAVEEPTRSFSPPAKGNRGDGGPSCRSNETSDP
jgi:hypothetical protein